MEIKKVVNVEIGQVFSCKYPQHGSRNILCTQEGVVEHVGVSRSNKPFISLKRVDGSYRSLRLDKMVEPRVLS